MKLNKFLAFALAAAALTACSDDDKSYNSAEGVTVSLGLTELNVPEDFTGTMCFVPVKLSGEANGPVTVTVGVTEGENPAIETAHYHITSKTVIIPKGVTEVSVEFRPTGDTEINDDRQFTMFIESVEGAEVAGNDRTEIKLLDDDHYLPIAYKNIQGTYTFTATNNKGASVTETWTVAGVGENEEGYLKNIKISGLNGSSNSVCPAAFRFDATTLTASLVVNYGTFVQRGLSDAELGLLDVMLASVNDGYLVEQGACTLTADVDYTELNFPSDAAWVGALFKSSDGSFTGYVYFWWLKMHLKKTAGI